MDFSAQLSTILEVIFINVVLSGDNAIVVGMAAAGTPAAIRKKVIFYGIGGLLLLWVCWKLYREIQEGAAEHVGVEALAEDGAAGVVVESTKTLGEALWQIIVADVSMSLDNVLAVAGAAHEHPWIMAGGLILSIALMGVAATLIARLLDRYRWLAWVGLIVIAYVAVKMIWEGGWEIEHALLYTG
jgi:YjbE family integral membrane protein